MSPRVVDKKEKKEQIIMAALQMFKKKGFSQTTINDIAGAAGIGKGTVYEYFSNKDDIINEAFHFFMAGMEPDFEEILRAQITGKEKMVRLLEGFIEMMNPEAMEMVELMLFFWSEGLRNRDTKGMLYQGMDKFYVSYREVLADIIIEGMGDGSLRKNLNPRSVAALIIGALDGVMVQWFLNPKDIDYHDIVRTLSDVLLNSITTRATDKETGA